MPILFKGTFNWNCELHTLYTQAKNESKAFNNFISQLTLILKISRRRIFLYFTDEKKDNWKIIEIKEPKCKDCNRTLSGYFGFHRAFYKCICGAKYKGFKLKEKK